MGAAAPALAAIAPGYWEVTTHVPPPVKQPPTERRCISGEDLIKFIVAPNHHTVTCAYPAETAADGRITFTAQCLDEKGRRYLAQGLVRYTPDFLHIDARVRAKLLFLPVTVRATSEARRLSAVCPAPRG